MSAANTGRSISSPVSGSIGANVPPTLEAGDHLTRAEFERRYSARPDIGKAELIEGVVYMPSPARYGKHGRPERHLSTWLGAYEAALLAGDLAQVLSVLQQGVATPEHAALVQRLAASYQRLSG